MSSPQRISFACSDHRLRYTKVELPCILEFPPQMSVSGSVNNFCVKDQLIHTILALIETILSAGEVIGRVNADNGNTTNEMIIDEGPIVVVIVWCLGEWDTMGKK